MSQIIKIKKGLDIKLLGESEKKYSSVEYPQNYAIKPPDFIGLRPKMIVREGEVVKAGTALFYHKDIPEIIFCSPVSGQVKEIHRGEKRVILEVIIESDGKMLYEDFGKADPEKMNREEIIEKMLKAGVWPFIRQRPYERIANPAFKPRSIFISGFDSAPLAPDYNFILEGKNEEFQTGINALKKLCDGKIHLSVNADKAVSPVFSQCEGVELHSFSGPHPSGNVGVQIHHIEPIAKDQIIWYCNPQDVVIIGRLFLEGRYNTEKSINLCGSEVINPQYYKLFCGASIDRMVKANIRENPVRYISGNVLTGSKINSSGFIGFYDSQVTVVPEGDYHEFLGWIAPRLHKFSTSRTFLSWLMPGKKYRLDTNLNGGHRAFIMTGEYEKVFPFDIYPVHLIKAIMIEDIDLMEKLGIYEVAPEDFALCEFVCTSKINVQEIVRNGLELIYKELN